MNFSNMPFSFSPSASTFFCIICNIVTDLLLLFCSRTLCHKWRRKAKLLIVAAMTDVVGKPDMPTRATRFWYIKLYSHKTILFTQITVIKLLTPTTFVRSVLDTHKGYDQKLENLHFQNFQALFHTKSGGYDLSLAHLQSMWLCDASTSASWRTNKIMRFASTSSRTKRPCGFTLQVIIMAISQRSIPSYNSDHLTQQLRPHSDKHLDTQRTCRFPSHPQLQTFFCIICNIVTMF